MPEPGELSFPPTEGTTPEPDATETPGSGSPVQAAEGDAAGPDRSRERIAVLSTLLLLLLGGAVLLRGTPWESSSSVHTLMESVATVMAAIVGALSLVRFYSRKQATFLFIGTGFLGAALLDLNHVLLTSEYFLVKEGLEVEDLVAWSWTAERVYLSLFLFVSLLAWRQELKEGEGEAVHEGSVYATALVLALVNLVFFEWVPLSRAHFPGLPFTRPAELVPGICFGLAFVGYLMKGGWRRDAFEYYLLVSLLISSLLHIAFMSLSETRHDGMFDAAVLLKIVSYAAIMAGLLESVYETFRREANVLAAITDANAALAREVAVRAQTEQAVKESRGRLQDFLDNANDLIQSVAPDGRILYVNSAWKRILGYGDVQLEQLNLYDIVHPAHRDRIQSEFARVLEGEPARIFTVEFVAADGRIVILSGGAAAQQVHGRPIATQGIFRDVTAQRLAERQLADSKANLTALVENTGDAIWSVDRHQSLITFNSAYSLAIEARTGREPRVGDFPRDVYGGEDASWYSDVYQRALTGDRHVALRTDQVEGQQRYFELYANPIQGDEGIRGVVLFGKDVTPRVRAEEALRVAKDEAIAANKAKSDFLASMSHELRTPLNSVIGFTNILLKNKDGHLNDKDVGYLQRVLANGKHLLELINEVLDLAKIEAGRMDLIIEPVDLGHLVVETVQQLEGQAKVKEGNVQLVADVPSEVAPVDTDSAKLKQVIINLVGNALKFTHEGSVTVHLDVAKDGKTPVAIAVKDTGIGIPADRLEAIFEAFQQAEAGTARKYGGTGLGLAISRSICLLMGYDLIVESEVGKGSAFTIVLGERARRPAWKEAQPASVPRAGDAPVQGRAAASAAAPTPAPAVAEDAAGEAERTTPAPPRLRDFKVLVVDDEKDSRDLMGHYLEDFGCRVYTATNGEEGLAAARDFRPDLITLDLMMPGMTGWEVLKHLKADRELRQIPVVVVSIVAGEGRGRLLGAVDLVTKPFEREDLLRVLWRNLVRKRGGRILVVDDEKAARAMLTQFLVSLGLEVVEAADGQQALDAIRMEAPDAVLLDLLMPVMDGMTFLKKLRANPLHTGLPVIVLTAKELSRQDEKELADVASGVVHKGDAMADDLRDALGSMFTLAAPVEEET
ncbi:MAG TPA: response regulator [Longimicrobiales bacterium]|nr:response regulator [Longimicrobiales bacterium]